MCCYVSGKRNILNYYIQFASAMREEANSLQILCQRKHPHIRPMQLGMNDTFFFALVGCAICVIATVFLIVLANTFSCVSINKWPSVKDLSLSNLLR